MAEDTKGSYSWIKFGPVSLQPAEFAKFATALALAKFMNVYGFTMSKLKYSLPVTGMILLPMLLIILQRETGSALVYLAFFLHAVQGRNARLHSVCRDLCCGLFCGWHSF